MISEREIDELLANLSRDPERSRADLERLVREGAADMEVASRVAQLLPRETLAEGAEGLRLARFCLLLLDGLRDGTIRKVPAPGGGEEWWIESAVERKWMAILGPAPSASRASR